MVLSQLPRYSPTPPPIDVCGTCRFWDSSDGVIGRCHYNAPLVLTQASVQTFWPQTNGSDWCGQYVVRA